MAKRKSKRCSERRKTKTVITNARKEAKLRREMNKNKRNSVKIPRSELMTDEEKQHLKEIKEGCIMRAKDIKLAETPESKAFDKLKEQEKICDCFIEVVDCRDIEGTRNREYERYLKENEHQVFVYLNYTDPTFESDLSSLKDLTFITDFSQFKNYEKICIFGAKKVGKFLLSKNIEDLCDQKSFELIRSPVSSSGASEVFRGVVEMNDVDSQAMIKLIWEFFEKNELQEYFRLSNFQDLQGFLNLLRDKMSKETLKNVTIDDAASLVLRTIKTCHIKWIKKSNRFYFKFNQ